jgi:hypothetical protein
VFVRRGEGDQPVCTVASYIVKAVDKSFDDLRDKTVMRFAPADVTRVTLIGGPVSLVLERAGEGKWQVSSQGRVAPAETPVAESLLTQLHDLKGNKIVEDPMTNPQRYGMEHPNLMATLADKAGKDIGTINVSIIEMTMGAEDPSKKPAKRYLGYATSTADKAVYDVPSDLVTDLEGTANQLKQDAAPKPSPTPGLPPGAKSSPVAAASPASVNPPAAMPPELTPPGVPAMPSASPAGS